MNVLKVVLGVLLMLQTFFIQPETVSGYALKDDELVIVEPVQQTDDLYNYCYNPSFEINTTRWNAENADTTISRDTSEQYSGVASLLVGNNIFVSRPDARYLSPVNVPAGSYSVSVRVQMPELGMFGGTSRHLTVEVRDGASILASQVITAQGQLAIGDPVWQYVTLENIVRSGVWAPIVKFYISDFNAGDAALFWVDALRIEPSATATGYFDGSYPNAYWQGAEHNSVSRQEYNQKHNGIESPLDDVMTITSLTGFRAPPVDVQATELAQADGALYDGTRALTRSVGIGGYIKGVTPEEMERNSAKLTQMFSRDYGSVDAPVLLRYRPKNCNSQFATVDLEVVYVGGLEGAKEASYHEFVNIQAVAHQPFWESQGQSAVSTTEFNSLATAYHAMRPRLDDWRSIGTFNNSALAVARRADQQLIVAGNFTAPANFLFTFDQFTPAAVPAAFGVPNAIVRAILPLPNGDVVVGGDFTIIGGVAINRIAYWTAATNVWSTLGAGGANNVVRALGLDSFGRIYAGGDFTLIGGVAANRVAYWNGTTWVVMGAGANASVYAIETDNSGNVFIGGDFTTPFSRVARWSASGLAFAALSSATATYNGATGVRALELDTNRNVLYIGGGFTSISIGAFTVPNSAAIVQWNSNGYQGLSGGITGTATIVNSIDIDPRDYLVHVVGSGFTSIPNQGLTDDYAVWNGSVWVKPDINLAGATDANGTVVYADQYALFVSYNSATSPIPTSAENQIVYNGTSAGYPTIRIENTDTVLRRPFELWNKTTGKRIWFKMDMLVGEIWTIDLSGKTSNLVSNYRGLLNTAYADGSEAALFSFAGKQTNIIAVFMETGITVTMAWYDRHWSASNGTF